MKSSPVLPILLGLSLCSAGGAYLYLYLKNRKDKKDAKENDVNLYSPGISPSKHLGEIEIKFVLSNAVVPLVCGRNGAILKNIEERTGVIVRFNEKDDSNQYCTIRGNSEAARTAEKLIKKEASRPPTFTQEIQVPQSACGKIIGRCGESLDEICRQSFAKVWIDPGSRSEGNQRRVLITGNQEQVNTAKRLIEEKVREDEKCRKLLEENELKREPRVRSPPSSVADSLVPREVLPPTVEKLRPTGSDGQLEVYVSSVASPSKFWLQIVGSQSAELDFLVDAMTEFYSDPKNQEKHKIRKPYLGQKVAALFSLDSKWYRAEIISIQPNDYERGEVVLDLYFVDYGDSQYVKTHEVFELRTDFLSLRFQAIECFLANVEPYDSVDGKWDRDAISRFEELTHVAQWKKMLSKVVILQERKTNHHFKRDGSPIPGVELYDTHNGRDINLAVEMVNENLARAIPKFGDLEKSRVLNVIDDVVSTQTTNKISTPTNNHESITNKIGDPNNVNQLNDKIKNNVQNNNSSSPNINGIGTSKLTNGNHVIDASVPLASSASASSTPNTSTSAIVNGTKSFLNAEKNGSGNDSVGGNNGILRREFLSQNWNDLLDDDEDNSNLTHSKSANHLNINNKVQKT